LIDFTSLVTRHAWLALALLAPAGQISGMGLMTAYEAALRHDPVYLAAVAENQAGQQFKVIGRAGLLPKLDYRYANSKNKATLTRPDGAGLPNTSNPEYTSLSSSFSLRQTLFDLDTFARYRQGLAQTNASDAQFASQGQELILRLVTAYTDVKYGQDQLALLVAQRNALAEQMRANQMKLEHGEGSKTDVLETEAKLDVAQAELIETQDQVSTARYTLAAMIGQDALHLDGLIDGFTARPLIIAVFADWQEIANNNNTDIAAGQFAVDLAEAEMKKSLAGYTPRVELNVTYTRSSSETLVTLEQDSNLRSIGVEVVVPLFSGGRVTAVARQAAANRDKAKLDLEATISKVMIELRNQFNAARSNITKVAALQKSVNSATLLLQATRQSVQGGVRVNLDVLNAQQRLVAAQRDLAQARYNYLVGLLKLRMVAGILGVDVLHQVAGYFSAGQ